MTAKRAAAYIRVSSEDQTDGWSLEGQEKQIREYAERNGYEVVQVYQDETSGSKDKRPGFERMLFDAHAGLFSAILVLHTSRLFRNVALARRYKDELRNKLNIEVLFVNQPLDANDGSGFMMETINELFDEYYLYQLRMWTSLGKQTRAQKGLYNGTLPFGYVLGENGVPESHPLNAAGLVMAFEAYSTGRYTDAQIAELLNREGYRTTGNWGTRLFTKDTVNRLLRNVFYLGYVKYKGQLIPGQHPALIDQALFDRCQEVRARRASKRRAFGHQQRVYVLAGLARCHICKLTLRCGATQSKSGWRYYRHTAHERGYECSVPGRMVHAEVVEAQWADIISAITLPEDWKQRIEELAGDADQHSRILREREAIQEKLRRLKLMYRDLLIDDVEYRTTCDQLQTRLSGLVLPNSPHLVRAGEYLENLGRLWAAATLDEQRDITRVLLKALYVDVLGEKIVAVEPMPIFRTLFTEFCADIGVAIL
jgi:site-specific DNA recombinase